MAIANLVGRTMISAKHIAKAISLAKDMALSKIKSLAKVMEFSRSWTLPRSWHGYGMKLVMKMDMNLDVSMAKISTMDFFMVADHVHSYSYRSFPVLRKDSFCGQHFF